MGPMTKAGFQTKGEGMQCEEAVGTILANRQRALVVATMSAIGCVDRLDPQGLNMACVPLMGGAAALGLGLSLARPERHVLVLDGDGSVLMQLATLVTAAALQPANFIHFVFNNGVWFENLANIPVPGAAIVDYSLIARGSGYSSIYRCDSHADLDGLLPKLLANPGPHFVELTIEPKSTGLWSAQNLQADLNDVHFSRMGTEARRLASVLAAEGGPNDS